MTKENTLDYLSLTSTISELMKVGETTLADKLLDIIAHNELPKPDKHNRKDDKTTSYFEVKISEDEREKIVDLFLDLEVGHLTPDGETTGAASHYSNMGTRWSCITPTK